MFGKSGLRLCGLSCLFQVPVWLAVVEWTDTIMYSRYAHRKRHSSRNTRNAAHLTGVTSVTMGEVLLTIIIREQSLPYLQVYQGRVFYPRPVFYGLSSWQGPHISSPGWPGPQSAVWWQRRHSNKRAYSTGSNPEREMLSLQVAFAPELTRLGQSSQPREDRHIPA